MPQGNGIVCKQIKKIIVKKLKKHLDSRVQVCYYSFSKGKQYKINLINISIADLERRQPWVYFKEKGGAWIQCQECGKLYHIDTDVPIDKLYIMSFCPRCDEYTKGLNCGDSKDDLYLYANVNVDPRYYQY